MCTRSTTLLDLGQVPEAAEAARRSLAVARELGYPDGEVFALVFLASAAVAGGDLGEAVRLARQAAQVPGDIAPSMARFCHMVLTEMLIQAGDFAAAEPVCAAALAACRDAGDLRGLPYLLSWMALLDLRAGRASDAAAHLREAIRLSVRAGAVIWNSTTWTTAGTCAPRPAGPPRPSRCGPRTPRSPHVRTCPGPRGTGGAAARGPAGAGTGPGSGRRAARRGDEPGRRRRVRPAAY